MPVILLRPRAQADLAELWEYIAEDSVARADAFIATVDQKFRTLAGQPQIGRTRDELEAGLRSFPVGRYVIFYQPLASGTEVVRVLHSARDVDALFHPEE